MFADYVADSAENVLIIYHKFTPTKSFFATVFFV